MKRCGQVIRVKPERYEEYKRHNQEVWPEIIDLSRQCKLRKQTIFHRVGLLLRYFEYTGDDHEADMEMAAVDPKNLARWRRRSSASSLVRGNISSS